MLLKLSMGRDSFWETFREEVTQKRVDAEETHQAELKLQANMIPISWAYLVSLVFLPL